MGGTRNPDGSWTGLASLETVLVGNVDCVTNAADGTGYGAVGYDYRIGKYEVTAAQYTEFLNKVAGVDTYGLYNAFMADTVIMGGCNIQRAGRGVVGDPYTYSVEADWANRPVNFVSFWDSCRFANWLHNGQPSGVQDNFTTEDGAYFLNGVTNPANSSITRKADCKWTVTSEDEWYKAAYYDPNYGGPGVPGYWLYPTSSKDKPSHDLLTPDGGNNANFYDGHDTIGPPYYRTPVGEFELSDSPYGTFDQGGNVWEWNEAVITGGSNSFRGLRGGSFNYTFECLQASYRNYHLPTIEQGYFGLRVVCLLRADVNHDSCVDVTDLLYFVDAFGTCVGDPDYNCHCDFNHDGCVDVTDLLDLVYDFGRCC
jgi:formylglycine-generating enzyme required for sulfatase activity